MFAAAMENCEAFTLLISKGADTTLKNCFDFTARGITEFRNQKLEAKYSETNLSKNPPTLITNGQHLQPPQTPAPPYIVISPHPSFYQLPPSHTSHVRTSSNTISPGYYFTTPNVTPITPINLIPQPQMFFPPEFSPNQVYGASPVPSYYNNSNDFLNARINSGNIYLSPVPQTVNYPSPCM